MLWNEDQSPRVKKETKPMWKRKWKSVFSGKHKDNVPKETRAVSVMRHELLEIKAGKASDKKDDRLLPHLILRQLRLTSRCKHSHRDQAIKRKDPCITGVNFNDDTAL